MENSASPLEFNIWLEQLASRLPAAEIEIVKRAYEVACAAHDGQTRASGEPFVIHSLAVAQMLAELGLNGEAIAAGLLHDVPEDTNVTVQDIYDKFGPKIAELVDSVTKLTEVEALQRQQNLLHAYDKKEYQRAESIRKMLLATIDDVRVVIIKLTDRLHNMRTLEAMPEYKRRRTAQETMDIFAPLANRLGIYQLKWELEDLAFRYLEPEVYYHLAQEMETHRQGMDQYVVAALNELSAAICRTGLEAQLTWRPRHIYSIHSELQRKKIEAQDIFAVMTLRVIVKRPIDCYIALGGVHQLWRPIAREFDDYIAAPKENGYQSLHTTVIDQRGRKFQVQIRTEKMHQQAEFGIATLWRYRNGTDTEQEIDRNINAMRQALKWQEDLLDSVEFLDAVKSDVIQERVTVYTPKGDIIDLPQGSTPIDFAYHIHTEVGNKCRNARVDGKLVRLDYQLASGNRVEILTTKRGGPSRDWLNENLDYVKTSRARKKIKQWFKHLDRQESIVQGRSILKREFNRLNINEVDCPTLATVCGYDTLDDFLAAVGYNDLSINNIVLKALEILPSSSATVKELILPQPEITPAEPAEPYQILGVGNMDNHLGNCCHPRPGDPIMGYITRGRGVTIHRQDCPNLLQHANRDHLIEVEWSSKKEKQHAVDIIIQAFDRAGLVRDITDIIAKEQINISNIEVITRRKNNLAEIHVTLDISSIDYLIRLMDRIEQLPNVSTVRRQRQ